MFYLIKDECQMPINDERNSLWIVKQDGAYVRVVRTVKGEAVLGTDMFHIGQQEIEQYVVSRAQTLEELEFFISMTLDI